MSQINVNRIKDSNKGAPDFPSGVNVSGVTSTVTLGVTNLNPTNVNVSGVFTATTFEGSMSATGTPTLGLGVTINASGVNISGVATAGIVSATTLYGDGSNLTGMALTIAPLNYNPAVFSQASHVAKASGIGLTFNQAVKAGSGNVTLSLANAGVAGTVVENFGVGNSVTYGDSDYGTTITITPTADLTALQDYHLSYPSGAFTTIGGDVSYVGTAYTFKGRDYNYQLWTWGYNKQGQAGLNNETEYSSPVQVPGTWDETALVGSDNSGASLFMKAGTLWSAGYADHGQLGQNNRTKYSSPVQIPGTWTDASMGRFVAFGIKSGGTLWTWGSGNHGMTGTNQPTNVDYSSPTQIPGTTWSDVTTCSYGGLATKTDGTLWSWGYNGEGNLAQNTPDNNKRSSPVQIPGTSWARPMVGSSEGCGAFALRTDGTLWAWGFNQNANLGLNDKVSRSSPVQIPGTNWGNVYSSHKSTIATKTDGTLWIWGINEKGQLGQNSVSAGGVSSPVQIPGTNWNLTQMKSTNNGEGKMALKTDGTLWGWGNNATGDFGLNNTTHYSSPTQVPGSWSGLGGTKITHGIRQA